jgi:hypothetical protein
MKGKALGHLLVRNYYELDVDNSRLYLLEHVSPLDVGCPSHVYPLVSPCPMLENRPCEFRLKAVTDGWQCIEWAEGVNNEPYYYVEQLDRDGVPIKNLWEGTSIHVGLRRFPEALIGDSTLEAPEIDPDLYGTVTRRSHSLEWWRSKTLLNGWTILRLDPQLHEYKGCVANRCDDCGHDYERHE